MKIKGEPISKYHIDYGISASDPHNLFMEALEDGLAENPVDRGSERQRRADQLVQDAKAFYKIVTGSSDDN